MPRMRTEVWILWFKLEVLHHRANPSESCDTHTETHTNTHTLHLWRSPASIIPSHLSFSNPPPLIFPSLSHPPSPLHRCVLHRGDQDAVVRTCLVWLFSVLWLRLILGVDISTVWKLNSTGSGHWLVSGSSEGVTVAAPSTDWSVGAQRVWL